MRFKRVPLKLTAWALLSLALLLAWLFTGYVDSYSDEEQHITFFVKKFPTFRTEFYNPDDSEGDYEPFTELSSEKKQVIVDYCKFRFGVISDQDKAIESCRKNSSGNPH